MIIDKYKPKLIKDLEVYPETIEQVRKNIKFKKPVLLYGPVGSGKTSAVYAIAKEGNYEVLEINASDTRNKDQIESIVGEASVQQSLFQKEKIILLDEVDGLSSKDRGGLVAITKILGSTKHAIVMTANDGYSSKLKGLRKKCKLIEFQKPSLLAVMNILKRIVEGEKIDYDESALKSLARRSDGDIRSAINDLHITIKNKELREEHLEVLGDREKEKSILNALSLIFKTTDPILSLKAFDGVNVDFNEAMLWIDHNLPMEYGGKSLTLAFDSLSKSDVHRGRISRQQYWRLLVYQIAMMTAGISLSKEEKRSGFVQYKRSTRPLKIWLSKSSMAKKTSIANKIAEKTHISIKKAKNELKYLMPCLESVDLELDRDEIAWLNKLS